MKKELVAWMISKPKIEKAPAGYAAAWKAAIERFKLTGRAGETCLVLDGPAPSLLVGVGGTDGGADEARAVHEAAILALDAARRQKFDRLVLGGVPRALRETALRGLAAGAYSFRVTAAKKEAPPVETKVLEATAAEERRARELAAAVCLCRELVNTPSSEKYPSRLAARIREEVKRGGAGSRVRIEIWDEKRLAREKCRGALAVGLGSDHPPRVVKLRYEPRGAKRSIALVGKGVTFDSGGLSLKTPDGMKTMKCDMAGAAAVVASVLAAARLKLPVRITAWVGLVENMLGGSAYKLGDIIRHRNGKMTEVLNTDAEGRLVIADLLALASESKPDSVIDLATLTGACMVALGEEIAGLFSTDETLAKALLAASAAAGECLWRLPLGRDFREKVKGEVSDLKNTGGRYGGASSAAQFLSEFVAKAKWAHLDIAGPAFRESRGAGRPSGATGFGVATLVEFLGGQR